MKLTNEQKEIIKNLGSVAPKKQDNAFAAVVSEHCKIHQSYLNMIHDPIFLDFCKKISGPRVIGLHVNPGTIKIQK